MISNADDTLSDEVSFICYKHEAERKSSSDAANICEWLPTSTNTSSLDEQSNAVAEFIVYGIADYFTLLLEKERKLLEKFRAIRSTGKNFSIVFIHFMYHCFLQIHAPVHRGKTALAFETCAMSVQRRYSICTFSALIVVLAYALVVGTIGWRASVVVSFISLDSIRFNSILIFRRW